MEVNNRFSGQQLNYESSNAPELCGRIINDEKINLESVGWFVRAVKEEPTDELEEKVLESRENAVNECEVTDTKREYINPATTSPFLVH
jgi:hypothetical protein